MRLSSWALAVVATLLGAGCAGPTQEPATTSATMGPVAPTTTSAAPRSDLPTQQDLDGASGQVQQRLDCVRSDLLAERWAGARSCLAEARQGVRIMLGYLEGHRDGLVPEDQAAYEAYARAAWAAADGLGGALAWAEAHAAGAEAAARADAAGWPHLRALELGLTGAVRAADALDAAAGLLEGFRASHARLAQAMPLEQAQAEGLKALAKAIRQERSDVASLAAQAEGRGYPALETLELPRLPAPEPRPVLAPDLEAHMDSFDADADGAIDIGEGAAFYGWAESTVRHRLDDEGEIFPIPGALPGDGRLGQHHAQSPNETWAERAGDGEDLAALQAAFYLHHDVAAYVAYLGPPYEGAASRAFAIVHLGPATDAGRLAGTMPRYEFAAANVWGIPEGAYLPLDNIAGMSFGLLGAREPLPSLSAVHRLGDGGERFAE